MYSEVERKKQKSLGDIENMGLKLQFTKHCFQGESLLFAKQKESVR